MKDRNITLFLSETAFDIIHNAIAAGLESTIRGGFVNESPDRDRELLRAAKQQLAEVTDIPKGCDIDPDQIEALEQIIEARKNLIGEDDADAGVAMDQYCYHLRRAKELMKNVINPWRAKVAKEEQEVAR